MLTEAAMKVGHSAVQPSDDDVHHVRIETHCIPEPTTTTSRLYENLPSPLQHGTQQPARPQHRRRTVVGRRRRPDGQIGEGLVGSGRGSSKVGPQLNLDVDGARGGVQDRQLCHTARKQLRPDASVVR